MATPRQLACFALLEAEKYPPESAAAFVGQFSQEVGVNIPSAFRHGPLDHGSQGIAQWRLIRLTRYKAYVIGLHPELMQAGMSQEQIDVVMWDLYGRLDYQIKFCAIECRTWYPQIEVALRRGGDIDILTDLLTWHFEIPAVATARADFRRQQAHAVFAAAAHIGSSPATQANVTKAQAQAKVQTNNTNAGGGIVLGGIIAGLHWMGGMPSHMAIAAGIGVGVLVLYSLYAAQRAAQEAGQAGAKAATTGGQGPLISSTPVTSPKVPSNIPEPALPTSPPQWVWNAKEGYWYFGEARPIPPAPEVSSQAPHPLMSDDIDDIVHRVVSALQAEIDADFKLKV